MARCAPTQNAQEFQRATIAAMSSRSATVHPLGPRITACVQAPSAGPTKSAW